MTSYQDKSVGHVGEMLTCSYEAVAVFTVGGYGCGWGDVDLLARF